MKIFIATLVLLVTFNLQAKVKEVDKSVATGNDAVIAVSNCSIPTVELYLQEEYYTSSFSYTICKEIKNYRAEVTSSDDWYNWSSEEVAIAGTESLSYKIVPDTEVIQVLASQNGVVGMLDTTVQCQRLQAATERAKVDVNDTGCVR